MLKYVVKYNVFIVFLFITVRFFILLIIFFIMILISAIFNFFWRVVFVSWYRDRWFGIWLFSIYRDWLKSTCRCSFLFFSIMIIEMLIFWVGLFGFRMVSCVCLKICSLFSMIFVVDWIFGIKEGYFEGIS